MTLSKKVTVSLLFLALTAILDLWGDTNPRSRLALLASLKEDQTFSIDPYKDWTIDWAKATDGHYYSNKAPGPVFLALPFYWILDAFLTHGAPNRLARDEIRSLHAERVSQALSLILQVIPFIALYFWLLHVLESLGLSARALQFFSLAYYFGTTATLFMNTFFGHGLAAVMATGLLLSLINRRWFLAGTLFGWGVLSDYGSALLLPATLIILWMETTGSRFRRFTLFALAGIVPGILWMLYHQTCFGSPWTLPNRFQNPMFVEHQASQALWGIFSYPRPSALFELLFGPIRGILFTQPWVLLTLLWLPSQLPQPNGPIRKSVTFLGISFLLLLTMNASFLNWHAGGSPGPRYLCAIFPGFALLGAYFFQQEMKARTPLWIGLSFTLLFAALVYGSHRIQNPEDIPVWRFFFEQVFLSNARMPIMRWIVFCSLMIASHYFALNGTSKVKV